jgi:hypothetical protein
MAKLVIRGERAAASAKFVSPPGLIQIKDRIFSWSG